MKKYVSIFTEKTDYNKPPLPGYFFDGPNKKLMKGIINVLRDFYSSYYEDGVEYKIVQNKNDIGEKTDNYLIFTEVEDWEDWLEILEAIDNELNTNYSYRAHRRDFSY